ncbi:MAG: restriction endonuclease subunit S [Chlorobi bacterium]|nr:restriction endonuclease subunit S [Chlorobiota bacterium]
MMKNKYSIPENWVWAKHEDISVINPKSLDYDLNEDSDVSFLPMACVEEVSGCYNLKNIRKHKDVKKGYTSFVNGDLIFAKITPCMENGKVAVLDNLVNGVGYGSTEFHVSRLHSSIDKKYLFFFVIQTAFRKEAKRNMTGSAGQLRVPTVFFKSVLIPIPPKPEQLSIVAKIEQLFSELDNGIACLKKAQEQLKVYRQAVLKQAFEGELTKLWREQQANLPSAQDLLDTIKADREQAAKNQGKKLKPVTPLAKVELDELTELPEGWRWVRLGDIARKIQIGPFGSQLHYDDYTENGVPLINPKHIKEQKLIPRVRISIDKANSLPQYFLEENDIIIGRRGEMGRTAPVLKAQAGWFCGTGSLYIRLGQNFFAKLYSLILSERRIVDYLEKKSRGTTMANLNSQIINSLPIQILSFQEQEQIVQEIETRLSVCDNMEATIRESLEKAEALRQSILKKAFEGKLLSEEELTATRNDPDWEPAEKLLERIRAEKKQSKKHPH